MPKFGVISHTDLAKYIGENLTMVTAPTGKTLKVAFGDKVAEPIFEICSNLLPHSMYIFINAIRNQQKVVDGRSMHVEMDFWQQKYYKVIPVLGATSTPAEKLTHAATIKKNRDDWVDEQLIKLGKLQRDALPITDTVRNGLMANLYKQKQNDLYCMRSVHLDKDAWLPPVVIPNALNAQQSAYRTYISDYTELPSNIQEKAKVKSDTLSAYVEYTAGNASADEEFAEPRWRIVYDWVNGRFFLTWHYQPEFFELPSKQKVKSPWVHIEHVSDSQGLAGPKTATTDTTNDFRKLVLRARGITSVVQ